MSKKTLGMVSALTALGAGSAVVAHAAPAPAVPEAASYADLLQPIPNALERLQQADAEAAARPAVLIKAQYAADPHHHHHHHHHHHRRRVRRVAPPIVTPPPAHHHHHHHNHN